MSERPILATSEQRTESPSLLSRLKGMRSSQFIRHAGETYATQVAKVLLLLLTNVIISRILGPEGRGIYAVAVAVGALGVQFVNLGLHSSNTYYVARDQSLAPALAGNSLLVSFALGGMVAVALAIFFTLKPLLAGMQGSLLILAVSAIPIGLAYLLLGNLVLGVQDIRGFNAGEIIQRSVPVLLLSALVIGHVATVFSALAVTIIGATIATVFVYRRLIQRIGTRLVLSASLFQTNLQYSFKAYLGLLFSFAVLRSDLFLVEYFRGTAEAGYYSVAANIADAISMLAVAIGTVLFPKLSANTNIKEKLRMTYKATVGTGLLLIPLLGIACLLAKPAIYFLFGKAFLQAAPAFIFLAPGMLALGVHAVAVQFLNSVGYPKAVVVIWGGCVVLNVGANLWVIPRWGMLGASVTSSICYAVAALLVVSLIPKYGRIAAKERSA